MAPVVHARRSQTGEEQREQPGQEPQTEVRAQPPAHGAPPAEGGGCPQNSKGDARRAQRDRVRSHRRGDRGAQRGEDDQRQVVGRAHRPLQRAAHVPDGEGVECEVQQILVQEIRREQSPGFAAIEDQRSGLGAVGQQSGNGQRAPHPAGRQEHPGARQQEEQRDPGDAGNGQQFARRPWTPRGILSRRGPDSRFFRPCGHVH